MQKAYLYQTRFGATPQSDGTIRFALWAPSCQTVSLEIEDAPPRPMTRDAEGVFTLTADCAFGARYRFRISEAQAVPDPASRSQPEGVHGPSVVTDPTSYEWHCRRWQGRPWEEAVIYELHAGLLGGFDGVRERLDELSALGITAIEIMPVNSFGGTRNWGYDGVLPYAPTQAYGDPDALKHLIDAAHAKGMMVILDVVYNHFGPDGNFLHDYAEDFFDHENNSTWGTGIAFARPQVADFFIDNVLYWLMEFRFDGVRIDAASAITDHAWFGKLRERVVATVEPGRHVHLILENENNDAELLRDGFTAQWNDDGHNVLHVMLTGETEGYYEMFAENPTATLARVLHEGFAYQGEINPYSGKKRGMPSGDLPASKFILFLQNHDQTGNRALGERLISLASPEALHAAYALLLLSPMTPMLFMGEEWGCTTPFLFFCDFHDELANAVREGRRKEFAKFSAFQDPEKRKTIPDPNALSTFDDSRPDREARATIEGRIWLDRTRSLLSLRKRHLIPRLPEAHSLDATIIGDKSVLARWKLTDGSILSIAINLSDHETCRITEPATLLYSSAVRRTVEELPPGSLVAGLELNA
ncbi:malto-oligosyltrehalose trehalohydrolase [Asaia krungthepensis]|uniref:Malto-oligosyltrehalose trehalohydrolase n=1 Tax=Asaia krungthepensis NRIC 0535 TaxID=1307925 RepID=A0ABQ0Q6T4_9PROT|nr:malto-oligosyltrehalose trehalohydrolase [Asaia krungthepensis]GBQ93953.1 malto-oligosyltrehalose trehalohydrolase [Asaia krungthepensis NRIC 0535]